MTFEFWLLLAAGAAAGGFINGLAGFGTALFALGFWLQILGPLQAVAMVLVLSVVGGIQGIAQVRQAIQPRRLAQFLVPGLVGIFLGVMLIGYLDADILKLVVAGFLIAYGAFFSFRSALPTIRRPTPLMDSAVGLAGGLLGGAAGLSGSVMTMWCATKPWSKFETRAVMQPFNFTVLFGSMVLFAFRGVYTQELMIQIAFAVPVTLLFVQLGIRTFKRLDDQQFRRLLIVLMLVSGLLVAARAFF